MLQVVSEKISNAPNVFILLPHLWWPHPQKSSHLQSCYRLSPLLCLPARHESAAIYVIVLNNRVVLSNYSIREQKTVHQTIQLSYACKYFASTVIIESSPVLVSCVLLCACTLSTVNSLGCTCQQTLGEVNCKTTKQINIALYVVCFLISVHFIINNIINVFI